MSASSISLRYPVNASGHVINSSIVAVAATRKTNHSVGGDVTDSTGSKYSPAVTTASKTAATVKCYWWVRLKQKTLKVS